MPNIVILGSLRYGDYKVTYPEKVCEDYHNEEDYKKATQKFYPAIDEADIVIVYGVAGEHTQRDISYAHKRGKEVIYLKDYISNSEVDD